MHVAQTLNKINLIMICIEFRVALTQKQDLGCFAGDPTYILVGEFGDEEFIRAAKARLGLDKPPHEQFLIYFL
jgi:ABC-type dipeptide/oligopeptide/nickel transport system permease component